MSIQGHFDTADSNGVAGWARNSALPDEKLAVEVLLDGEVRGEGIAHHYRADLETNGVGHGKYAFYVDYENGPIYGSGRSEIEVRIKGTEVTLDGGPKTIERSRYKYVAIDIVDNCNLRCPFCLYDYANTKTTHRMNEEVFRKILKLIPHVPRGEFWLSCLHEPSMHPQFLDFLELVPEEFRKKVFFTSNFARKQKDEYFHRLADTNIQHINISVDSVNPELYPILRKGSKLDVLFANLEKLHDACSKNPRSPNIRFITMVFKSNFDEIPEIVKMCSERFGASEHELRYPYKLPHITDEFRENHFLENHRWGEVEKIAAELNYPVFFDPPTSDYSDRVYTPIEYYMDRDPYNPVIEPQKPGSPFGIRFSANGDGRIEDFEEHFHFNVNMLEDPHSLLSVI